jgi:hypothetical protein
MIVAGLIATPIRISRRLNMNPAANASNKRLAGDKGGDLFPLLCNAISWVLRTINSETIARTPPGLERSRTTDTHIAMAVKGFQMGRDHGRCD